MKEVCNDIFVGSIEDLGEIDDSEYAIVHATKTVFDKKFGYIIYERDNHLYLNWVDADDSRYFDYNEEGALVVIQVLNFIDKWAKEKKIFIHCDEGKSRSPSIAMLYMSKRLKVITDKDHVFAEREFTDIYQPYFANKGISDFLFKNWFKIK
jgi:hypothetical protein